MKCSIQGCPGEYEPQHIIHTLRSNGEVIVFEDVPAEVCSVCSDVLLAPHTIRRLEELLRHHPTPRRHVPVYAFS